MQTHTDHQWWKPSRTIPLFGPNRRLLHSIVIVAAIQASSALVFTQTSDPSNPNATEKVLVYLEMQTLNGPACF